MGTNQVGPRDPDSPNRVGDTDVDGVGNRLGEVRTPRGVSLVLFMFLRCLEEVLRDV